MERVRPCFLCSRRRPSRLQGDWSSDVCSSDLATVGTAAARVPPPAAAVAPAPAEPRGGDAEGPGSRARPFFQFLWQVGRRAWRGEGWVLGGGGSLKKKKRREVTDSTRGEAGVT